MLLVGSCDVRSARRRAARRLRTAGRVQPPAEFKCDSPAGNASTHGGAHSRQQSVCSDSIQQ
jgi:hypothetical protein